MTVALAVQSALWMFRESRGESYLLLGTSTGHIQVHSSDGQMLHRQRLHIKAVTAIAVRCAGMQAGGDDSLEDVTICFEDAVARFSSPEVGPRHQGLLCSRHPATVIPLLRKWAPLSQGHQDARIVSAMR